MQILGCYNSTPLKMNLVLEIRKTSTKRWEYSVLGFFFTSSCSSIVLIKIHFTFAYLLPLLQVTCLTNSKTLIGTLNNSQVTLITRPQFSFLICSPSLITRPQFTRSISYTLSSFGRHYSPTHPIYAYVQASIQTLSTYIGGPSATKLGSWNLSKSFTLCKNAWASNMDSIWF